MVSAHGTGPSYPSGEVMCNKVVSCIPIQVIAAHGTEITTTFYPILFHDYPEVKVMFNKHDFGEDGEVSATPSVIACCLIGLEPITDLFDLHHPPRPGRPFWILLT